MDKRKVNQVEKIVQNINFLIIINTFIKFFITYVDKYNLIIIYLLYMSSIFLKYTI
jgi:hypothetical protein